MTPSTAAWVWRIAVVGALLWIGWEVHELRADLAQPVAEQAAEAQSPDPGQDEAEATRAELAQLNLKLDAVMAAMMQLKR